MGKYTGKFEDLIDLNKDDPELDKFDQDDESVYWIHRTYGIQLYFNPNYKENGCPMLLTFDEIQEYFKEGKNIKNCIDLNLYYSDEKSKEEIDSIVSEDELEEQLLAILNERVQSFFEKGIYMPDIYRKELDRVANRFSAHRMQKIFDKNNFGFNPLRGVLNIAFILEIPTDEINNIYERVEEPFTTTTEYLDEQKVSNVISTKYIKGAVIKFGNKKIYIKNPMYKGKTIEESREESRDMLDIDKYLYHTEDLFKEVIDEFMKSELSNSEKVINYINKLNEIWNKFRYYAVHTTGFVTSSRHKEVVEYYKTLPRPELYKEDTTKGNYINMINSNKYYDITAKEIESIYSINEKEM